MRLPDEPREGQREQVALGISNLHKDRIDSRRRRGVPIVYAPRVTDAARRHPLYNAHHPLPSSDLVLAENGCEEAEGGGGGEEGRGKGGGGRGEG